MRSGRGRYGLTVLELLGASSVATIVGGAILLLVSGMRTVYQTHVTLNQLSGYLDVATAALRSDVWGAAARCDADQMACPACPGCPGGTLWLGLDMGSLNAGVWADGDIRYTLDPLPADGTILTLVRRVRTAGAWPANGTIVAQYMANDPLAIDLSLSQAGRVGLKIQVSRTVNGRTYVRLVDGLSYRMQVQ